MKKIYLFILSALVLTSGCVTSSKYKALEDKEKQTSADNENYKLQLGAAQSKITELNGKLGLADNQRTQLEDSVNEMKTAMEQTPPGDRKTSCRI